MNKKALWITSIALIVIGTLIFTANKQVSAPVSPDMPPAEVVGEKPMGKLPAGSQAPGDPKLLVGTWMWQKTVMRDGSVLTPKKAGIFALTLSADGKASGKTDCNGFGGEYTVGSDGILSFGPFMSTQMYCEGSQEAQFSGPLAKANKYSFDAQGNLVIGVDAGAGTVVFVRK
jgi:heat shock protein HslJ